MSGQLFSDIYRIVAKIPRGKILTYKKIATILNIKDYRLIGYALHSNPDPNNIPCHRVVRSDGNISTGYAFGGMDKQKELLLQEGINLNSEHKIDISYYMWKQID